MRIQSQANQFPGVQKTAAPDAPPSQYFDAATHTVNVQGEEFDLAWTEPNEVEVIHNGQVVRYLEPDDEWSPGDYTGWEFIEILFERIADQVLESL